MSAQLRALCKGAQALRAGAKALAQEVGASTPIDLTVRLWKPMAWRRWKLVVDGAACRHRIDHLGAHTVVTQLAPV
eukprot:CAMPEP_0174696134 /NCGR_PEP_ID=MMETSP1094-20130205/2363_1 /TAXON_ID=156173 /ORGANISM="Chrysochromulina brevifilum, Strain UTEX LB 985" /LENGTH=75 /DNA_ID=CAMNT_0015892841 /DNA_START=357 /DNA_END=583 /DNA_ORIENTATION=-